MTRHLFEKKKNGQIKGMVSMMLLILSYTMQHVIASACTKVQNRKCSSF